MALIPYKEPGDSLDAAAWNEIFAEADDIISGYLNGLSPLFFGDKGDPRKFFFFNPVVPPSGLHPLAAAWLPGTGGDIATVRFGFWRQYNHSAITDLIGGLAIEAPATIFTLTSMNVYNNHPNYQAGDVLTLVGGTFFTPATIQVDTVIPLNGNIKTCHILNPGQYITANPGVMASTGGNGLGATFYALFGSAPNPVGVVKLTGLTCAAWHTALYPENGYGANDNSYQLNLDICLSVLTRDGKAVTLGSGYLAGVANGFPCHLGSGEVEIAHNYDAVELIVIGNLTFDSAWDKYGAFRIHNFGMFPAYVTFPGNTSVVVPPGGCKCVRRSGGGFTLGYNYFQKMLSGDPRFFAVPSNNMTSQFCPFNLLTYMMLTYMIVIEPGTGLPRSSSIFGNVSIDASEFWDMSSLYSALLAPPQGDSVLFDLVCGFGPVGVSPVRTANAVTLVDGGTGGIADGTNIFVNGGAGTGAYQAYVILHTNGAGVVTSVALSTGGQYTTIPTNPVNCVANHSTVLLNLSFPPPPAANNFTGWASIASVFASYGCTWSFNPATKIATVTAPASGKVLIDRGCNLAKCLTVAFNPSVHSIALGTSINFDLSQTSTFRRCNRIIAHVTDSNYTGGIVVHNNDYVADPTDNFGLQNVTFTITDTIQKILDCLNLLSCPLIQLLNVEVLITPLGPMLCWEEVYTIDKHFNALLVAQYNTAIVDIGELTVTLGKSFMLAGGFQNFFASLGSAPQVHFPRQGRVYSALRAVPHQGSLEPWQSNYSVPYTTYEPPRLKRFFESMPVGTEAPLAAADSSPVLPRPDGANYMGPLDGSSVPANATEQLLCQAEHFNALASQINGVPNSTAKFAINAGLPPYAPGGYDLGGGAFLKNCFYSWAAPATGVDTLAAFLTSNGCPILTNEDVPDGRDLAITAASYTSISPTSPVLAYPPFWSSGNSPWGHPKLGHPLYRWITIDAARELYAAFNLPFILNTVLEPLRYVFQQVFSNVSFNSGNPPGYDFSESGDDLGANWQDWREGFVPDASGNWACFYNGNATALMENAVLKTQPSRNLGTYNEITVAGSIYYYATPYFPWCELDGFVFNSTPALIFLCENTFSSCAVIQPKNYVMKDGNLASIGADNTQEDSAPQVTLIDGVGGAGLYEHVITCPFANAQLLTFPVNNEV